MLFNRNIEAPLNPNDFPRVAKDMGFSFSLRRGRVDWYKIDGISIDRIVQERDLTTLQGNLLNVVNYNLDSEYDVKILDQNFVKLFRLAQLSVDYLLYSEQHLFNCVELLREQLAKSVEDIEKLKEVIKKREDDIKCLKKKIKEKPHEAYNPVNETAPYFKCAHCAKTFSNSSYLSSHLLRRHSVASITTTMVTKPPEVNKAENEILHLEIIQLKERLNNTDRLLQNDKLKNMQAFGKDAKFDEMLEKLNKKYVEEITSMTNTFHSEIQKLKDTKPDTKIHQELMAKILKQELEIKMLQEQITQKVAPMVLSSPTTDVSLLSGQLEAQENFWKSRLNALEDKYAKQMEEIKTSMNKNESKITVDYENKIEELIMRTAKQEEMLKIQEKQVQQLCTNSKTANVDSKLNTENEAPHLKSNKLAGNNSSSRAAFRNRALKQQNTLPQPPDNLDLEQAPEIGTKPETVDIKSAAVEQPEIETVILPESFVSRTPSQTQASNVGVDQVPREPRVIRQDSITQSSTNNSVTPERRDVLTASSSDSTESNEDVEYTDVHYFPVKKSAEQQNHTVNDEPEYVANKQSKSDYVDDFVASTEDDDPDSSIAQSPPKKSASSPSANQQPKFDEIRRVQSSAKPPKTSNYDGWNKVAVTREVQHVDQSKRHNSKHLDKEDFDDNLVEEDEEENTLDESERTDTDESLTRRTSNELALHSVKSLEKALAKNPQVLEEFKLDIKQQFDERLREFGIDPEWKGIPQATYKHNMETLKHHQTITAKKYPSFFKVKQQLVNNMEKRLGTSVHLESGGSGDKKHLRLTQSTPSQKMKRFDKVVGSVKRKAFGIFERTKQDRKADQPSSKLFPNKRVAQKSQRRKNLQQLTHSRMHLNFREKENLNPITTSTPLKLEQTRLKNKTPSSTDESKDSDEAANNLPSQNYDKVQTLWPEIHTPPDTQIKISQANTDVTTIRQDSPESTRLSSQMSKSQDFLHRTLSHRELSKSALKSALSTGSLTKKRVLFTDQDTDKEQTWDSSLKNARKSVQFTDEATQPVLAKPSEESHSDWEPSSDEYEIDQPSKSNEHINLSTKQSDKIAQISRDIEHQLNRTRTKPPGGVEAMPHDTSSNSQQYASDLSLPQTLSTQQSAGKSDVSKASTYLTRTNQSDFNQSRNALASDTEVPVPVPRQKNVVKTGLMSNDWDLEDFGDILSD